MSHFSVLYIGDPDKLEEAMLPYHEYECTGIEQYLQEVDETDEFIENHKEHPEKSVIEFAEYYYDISSSDIIYSNQTLDELEDGKYYYLILNEDGSINKFVRRTNPNKKWDWWVISGRWKGAFLGKDGEYHSSIRKGDIDIEKMLQNATDDAIKEYDEVYQTFVDVIGESYSKDIEEYASWDKCRTELFANNIEAARDFYHEQPLVRAIKVFNNKHNYFGNDVDKYLVDKETFIHNCKLKTFSFFACLKDNTWYQRGDMGWFACVSNVDDSWDQKINELFFEASDDEYVTCVDCHI